MNNQRNDFSLAGVTGKHIDLDEVLNIFLEEFLKQPVSKEFEVTIFNCDLIELRFKEKIYYVRKRISRFPNDSTDSTLLVLEETNQPTVMGCEFKHCHYDDGTIINEGLESFFAQIDALVFEYYHPKKEIHRQVPKDANSTLTQTLSILLEELFKQPWSTSIRVNIVSYIRIELSRDNKTYIIDGTQDNTNELDKETWKKEAKTHLFLSKLDSDRTTQVEINGIQDIEWFLNYLRNLILD